MSRFVIAFALTALVVAAGIVSLLLLYEQATAAPRGLALVRLIDRTASSTLTCERELRGGATLHVRRHTYLRPGRSYRLRVLALWRRWGARCARLVRHLNALPPRAIKYVFRGDSSQALHVASGESGSGNIWRHPYCTRAANGQYLGCFQMGHWARSTYGHGRTALKQAWAAHRYVVDAGGWCSGWSQTAWGC